MSAKSKSALPGTPNTKSSPATPRVSRVTKSSGDSISSLQNARFSVDRSPGSVTSKPKVERSSPKVTTPIDRKAPRIVKPSLEVQAELNQAQEDLKKVNEKLVLYEKEKEKAIDELKEAKRLCDEANEKLMEALAAQKRAEEDSEIEKFRAVELGIESVHRKEEEWVMELESVRNQHAVDVAALISVTQELQQAKQELAMTSAAKNQALEHADYATKIAEIHAEKVEALNAELIRLKGELDSRVEMAAIENDRIGFELKREIDSLRRQLDEVKVYEEKLVEKEAILEEINVDLEALKMAECYARNLVGELHLRIEELTFQIEEANKLEKSATESLGSVMKQLEEKNGLLHDAKSEIVILGEKIGLLEISSERQKTSLDESERRLEKSKEEASRMVSKVGLLESELEALKADKIEALRNEKVAEARLQSLVEEKNELVNELEMSRDEEDKSKAALESLASALHEVSSEARVTKEKLISMEAEHEKNETRVEDLRRALESTNEKYESMLDDAKKEINALSNSIQRSKQDCDDLKAELEEKELDLKNSIKKSEEENSHMEIEVNRLTGLLIRVEEEVSATREEGNRWKKSLKEADLEVVSLKEAIGETKDESLRLKENLNDTENELQKTRQENDDLRKREAASLEKIEELSKLLEEAMAKKQEQENGDLTDYEKDYDVLPKVVEFSEQNGTEFEFKTPTEKLKEGDEKEDSAELKMWESCKIDVKDLSAEEEAFEDEVETRTEGGGDLYDQVHGSNGGTSPLKSSSQKKKKALLHKFGNLLKKKGSSNQK